MAAVDEIDGMISAPQVRPYSEVAKGYTAFLESDVLFAKITPCMENGKAAIAAGLINGIGFGSTEFHVLRAGGRTIPDYLFYIVRQSEFRSRAKVNFTGTAGQQRVPTLFLQKYPIHLPPIDEQRRIVDILNRAQGIQKLRRQASDLSRQLSASLLNRMLG